VWSLFVWLSLFFVHCVVTVCLVVFVLLSIVNTKQKTKYWEQHAFGSKEVHHKVIPLSFFEIANSSLQT
jgi:biopolymer transport protein ExbB/TolQ